MVSKLHAVSMELNFASGLSIDQSLEETTLALGDDSPQRTNIYLGGTDNYKVKIST